MTFEFRQFRLRFCFSFFALIGLMLLFSDGAVALVCLASSMLHEGGHLLFLVLFSADLRAVSFGAGGIVIERGAAFCGTAQECLIALGGIFVNAALCLSAALCYGQSGSQTAAVLCLVNGVLAGLNLLPVRSLDCYRVLDLLLRKKAAANREILLQRISFAAVVSAFAGCIFLCLCGVRNLSLAAVCVYLMLLHWKRS